MPPRDSKPTTGRTSTSTASSRSGSKATPNAKSGPGTKATPTGKDAPPAKATPAGGRTRPGNGPSSTGPQRKRPTKSIVNQKQTPWGLIATTVLVVIFAVGIIGYAVTRSHNSTSSTSYLNELADAKSIAGVTFKAEPDRNHVSGTVKYDSTPPVGGNHSPVWADCTGTVYPNAIASENAVHTLEHGAVWITYKPGLPAADVATLTKLVDGVGYMIMSPYPDLKSNISLQAWGYQLFVDNASDSRIQQFIDTLKENPKTTPEQGGSCTNAAFKAAPSTPGHPVDS